MLEEYQEIDKIIHHKYSADLFQDQKRKISELKSLNEHTHNVKHDKSLVITPNQRSKNKSSGKVCSQNKENKEEGEFNTVSKFDPFNYKNKDLILSLEDFESWDYSSYDYEIIDSEDVPIINSPFWPFEELGGYNKENGVDIRNIVLKSVCQFNMSK